MKIKSIRLENFRSFRDETISLNKYSCFVGPNGAGKSSVLAALNVFFREQASFATDINKLTDEDYFCKDTTNPVRITVTFDDLNQVAQKELSDYVRQNELVVTAEAIFDANAGVGQIRHFGNR
ncbi:MAG: AAA family ATPase, partial [Candidatus Nomurabacteria bacterium]|nr:AAA family ATPase [Candidatus Nomurabacteria bacterium]